MLFEYCLLSPIKMNITSIKFKKALGFKMAANITFVAMLLGGIIFTLGFGACLILAREEITKEVDAKVKSQIQYLESFVDGQLQRIEDAGYSLGSSMFGNAVRCENSSGYIQLDQVRYVRKTPEECFPFLEQFMEANPVVCGIAIEFAPQIYSDIESTYGFTPYVTRVTGKFERLDLGMITNSYEWDWWTLPLQTQRACWVSPFRDSSAGHVIACYVIPVLKGNQLFAVIAVDIDTEAFTEKCKQISPYPESSTSMLDHSFRYISHENKDYLFKHPEEIEELGYLTMDDSLKSMLKRGNTGRYRIDFNGEKALFYFAPIKRAGWMVNIYCPEYEVYGGMNSMRLKTSLIALFSILIMVFTLILVFRRFKAFIASEAGMESELKVASSIQMGMLPKIYPAFPERRDVDVYGFQKPAKSVGGDLYDYFIRDGKFFFCIGDVSGKGVPASLYMAVISALFRNVSRKQEDPSEIVTSINNALCDRNDYNMFCTIFVGVLDLATGHLDFCNGGHNPPIILRKQSDGSFEVKYVDLITNLAIGAFSDYTYRKEDFELAPGDMLFLYTDGLTEAEDVNKRLFGEKALIEVLEKTVTGGVGNVKDYVDAMYRSLLLFTYGAEQADDITMMNIEFKGLEKADS